MPRLACYSCGRSIWATVPLDELFADERRCPRCGASLGNDRRNGDRRAFARRQAATELVAGSAERRLGDRRLGQRRRKTA